MSPKLGTQAVDGDDARRTTAGAPRQHEGVASTPRGAASPSVSPRRPAVCAMCPRFAAAYFRVSGTADVAVRSPLTSPCGQERLAMSRFCTASVTSPVVTPGGFSPPGSSSPSPRSCSTHASAVPPTRASASPAPISTGGRRDRGPLPQESLYIQRRLPRREGTHRAGRQGSCRRGRGPAGRGHHVLEVATPTTPEGRPSGRPDGVRHRRLRPQRSGRPTSRPQRRRRGRLRSGLQVEYDQALGSPRATLPPAARRSDLGRRCRVGFAFGSLIAMSLPILVALVGLLVGTSTIGLLSGDVAVPEIATTVE